MPPRRPPSSDGAVTVALLLFTLASTAGFSRVFTGATWFWPVLACAVAAHGACWLARRSRLPQPVALVLALVVLALVAIWTTLGPQTHFGIPDFRTWHALTKDLRQVRQEFSVSIAPIPASPGFKLIIATGTGIVAIISDWIAFRWRSVLVGVVPGLALFITCASSGQGSGRALAVFLELVTFLGYLVAHRFGSGTEGQVWFAGVRSGLLGWALRVAAITGGIAVLSVLLLGARIHGEDGVGAFGWRSGSGPGGGGDRLVPNPIVDMQTELLQLSTQPAFAVTSKVPSYWRLTSLDTFNGQNWSSTGTYRSFTSHLPGNAGVPAGTETITESFQVDNLDSPWLPAAFNPVEVQGVSNVSYDSGSDSLLVPGSTQSGEEYTVVSYQYLSSLSTADLEAAPPVSTGGSLHQDVELPSSVPPNVYALAKTLTAGKTTEYDKAIALQDYLRSPRFHYTLHPVSDGSGTATLENFLFSTRQGYCQQFASAFAVMARALGLPTRLAVGFATGVQYADNTYQIYGSDAHTWPEVYFGPKYGWIPFEPTPSFSNPTAEKVDQTAPGGLSSPSSPTTTPVTTVVPNPASGKNLLNKGHATTGTTVAPTVVTHRNSGGLPGYVILIIILAAAPAWAAGNIAIRRARWHMRRSRSARSGPPDEVLARWADVNELLAWRGLVRLPNETDDEFGRRAAKALGVSLGDLGQKVGGQVARLAELACQAEFAPTVGDSSATEAATVAAEIHHRLIRRATRSQLIMWAFLPRPGGHRPARA